MLNPRMLPHSLIHLNFCGLYIGLFSFETTFESRQFSFFCSKSLDQGKACLVSQNCEFS